MAGVTGVGGSAGLVRRRNRCSSGPGSVGEDAVVSAPRTTAGAAKDNNTTTSTTIRSQRPAKLVRDVAGGKVILDSSPAPPPARVSRGASDAGAWAKEW